jgi:hypothetical protein
MGIETCRFKPKLKENDWYNCPEAVTNGDNKCIFHSRKKIGREADIEQFYKALQKKIEGKNEPAIFIGFVFPLDVNLLRDLPNNIFGDKNNIELISNERNSKPSKSVVSKGLDFGEAVFLKGFSFGNFIFESYLNMTGCEFHGGCDFSESEFIGRVLFRESEVKGDGVVFFNNIKIFGSIDFRDTDLGRWSFMRTDICKVDFSGCRWGNGNRPELWRMRTKFLIYEELFQKWDYAPLLWPLIEFAVERKCKSMSDVKRVAYSDIHGNMCQLSLEGMTAGKEKEVNYEEVLNLYRALRMNYESKLHFQEAGDFHIGEMETRRLALFHDKSQTCSIRWVKYFAMWLYKVLSGYGERYLRAAGSLFAVVIIFSILFMFSGLSKVEDNKVIVKSAINYSLNSKSFSRVEAEAFISDYCHSLTYSFSVATIFIKDRQYIYEDEGWSYKLYLVESCLGAILLPLLVLAVRRNFKRSEREKFYGS